MSDRPTFASSTWHRPHVTVVGEWDVSDNGENVVAFGPNHQQADFGHGTDPAAIAAYIEAVGPNTFAWQARVLRSQAASTFISTLTLDMFTQFD